MHAAIQFGFSDLLGMPREQALALAILLHGTTYIFTVLYCLTFLLRGKVSIFELGKAADSESRSK
jgi:hypothetical protein